MEEHYHRLHLAIEKLVKGIDQDIEKESNLPITKSQVFLLHAIHAEGKCKVTRLAKKMDVKPSAITVMIDRIEKQGLVKRVHDKEDRRSVIVEMTPEGVELIKKTSTIRNYVFQSYLKKLSEEEINQLISFIEKMVQSKDL